MSTTTKPFVPLSSALTVAEHIRVNKGPVSAFGYYRAPTNSVQDVPLCEIISGCFAHGNGAFITSDTFDQAMIAVAVRKAITPTWLNDRDQFRVPHTDPTDAFVTDCTVFNLFSGHNSSSSWTAIYDYTPHKIENAFYPFEPGLAQKAAPQQLRLQRVLGCTPESWVSTWMRGRIIGALAGEVLAYGRAVYELLWCNWCNVDHVKWKPEDGSPGGYQVRNALQDRELGEAELGNLRLAVKLLRESICERVYADGYLPTETLF